MKCPLRIQAYETEVGKFYHEAGDCLREECAWWDEVHGACCILAVSKTLVAMGNTIGKIADRMPKDLAPRG